MKSRRWLAGAVAGLMLGVAPPVFANPSAEEVKALFLIRFTHYVSWPEDETSEPFRYCTLNAPEVQSTLEAIAGRGGLEGREFEVDALDSVNSTTDCELVYLGAESGFSVSEVSEVFDGRPTLLVADSDESIGAGAAIRFVMDGGRVRFEIDTDALDLASLKASSQLLKLARRTGQ
ncbi:MAG: YfiR family protein [Proteobacteria bacterium]|nr:YfiR family protein [Pseudomonadota bacterium]